jgi:hypothetical protein
MGIRLCCYSVFLFLAGFTNFSQADSAFDLSGPRIDIKVTRAGKTLPIAEVPNLQPGDRVWVRSEMPASQSVHYLLVAAFLRGSTNPPPDNWFMRAETWSKDVREEGIVFTVPPDAQQALLFLAPRTGGDFSSLRSAVQRKPGAFVRASQDLSQASLDRTRLDRYLSAIRQTSASDPAGLHEVSLRLARSLAIKVDEGCFDKPSEQQAPCLTRNTEQLVLEDGHSQSMVAALTSAPNMDLVGVISGSKLGGGGAYSSYIGAFVDVAHIMENLHTAEYQYIPALALPKEEQVDLRLNNPPSFSRPKSVLVMSLPAVEAAQFPPLRAVDPKQVFCLETPSLVLPAEGAPLVFSTALAHDFVLHIDGKSGTNLDLPAHADPLHGGFAIDTRELRTANLEADLRGTLRGYWGFEPIDGPVFQLRSSQTSKWEVASADQNSLIVGREGTLRLHSNDATCVDDVTLKNQQGKVLKTIWKVEKPDELKVQVPLKDEAPGAMTMLVQQHGLSKPDEVPLHTYSEVGRLDRFTINVGDQNGVLTGTRLDEVAGLEVNGIHFLPAGLSRVVEQDQLRLSAPDAAATANLRPGEKLQAQAALKDGRVLPLQTEVEAPRPRVTLISKNVQLSPTANSATIRLANPEDFPQDGRLSFFIKSEIPSTFPRTEKIEVANQDESSHVELTLADGGLTLQDSQTILAVLDPLKSLGASVFGPLRFRPVDPNGVAGDWQSLASVVRVPSLKEVSCPDSPDKQCTLSGTSLFLIDSIASDSEFKHSAPVPVGFSQSSIAVPRPNGTLLYIKLRDDPAAVNLVALPVLPEHN